MSASRNDNDKTYTPDTANPADTGNARVDPDNNKGRTRIHGHTKPMDLWLPEGDGTVTREEYYRCRGDD